MYTLYSIFLYKLASQGHKYCFKMVSQFRIQLVPYSLFFDRIQIICMPGIVGFDVHCVVLEVVRGHLTLNDVLDVGQVANPLKQSTLKLPNKSILFV